MDEEQGDKRGHTKPQQLSKKTQVEAVGRL